VRIALLQAFGYFHANLRENNVIIDFWLFSRNFA